MNDRPDDFRTGSQRIWLIVGVLIAVLALSAAVCSWLTIPVVTPKDLSGLSGAPLASATERHRSSKRLLVTFDRHSNIPKAITFLPNSNFVVSGARWGRARIWDYTTGKELHSFDFRNDWGVESLAAFPDGKQIVAGSLRRGAVWKTRTGTRAWTLKIPSPRGNSCSGDVGFIRDVGVSFDGQHIVVAGMCLAAIFDAMTGRQILVLHHDMEVSAVAFSPDGRRVATASSEARLWDARSGKMLLALHASEDISDVEFSPTGHHLLTASGRIAQLWDGESGKMLVTFTGHTDDVVRATHSPDGRLVATASFDRTVKLWASLTGEEVATLSGHDAWVRAVAFSMDGSRVATGGDDKTVKIWDVSEY